MAKEAFKCLGFLKRCRKYFTLHPYYLQDGASRSILKLLGSVQEMAKVLINDNRVSNSITSLEHRRACNQKFLFICMEFLKAIINMKKNFVFFARK